MRLTKRQVLGIAAAAGGLVVLAVIGSAFRSRPSDVQPIAPPVVPQSTSREGRPKADDLLSKLQPGMLRVDVEAVLGPPTAVDSVRSGNGRLSYRATFSRDRLRPPLPPLVLEFDATQPGTRFSSPNRCEP